MASYPKDPSAVLDYTWDWATWLDGDTIVASTWAITSGGSGGASDLAIDSENETTTATTVWLSKGVAGTTYQVTNHITTAAGRQDDRSIRISVTER